MHEIGPWCMLVVSFGTLGDEDGGVECQKRYWALHPVSECSERPQHQQSYEFNVLSAVRGSTEPIVRCEQVSP